MNIFEHPGNLGPARGKILTNLHANWPAYPQGDDFFASLLQMTALPARTKFIVIDDIDLCLLLMADVSCAKPDKPFEHQNFHVAVWHDDLVEMNSRSLVDGIQPTTHRDWLQQRWNRMISQVPKGRALGFKDSGGKFVPLKKPKFDDYDYDDDLDHAEVFVSHDDWIQVTDKGRDFLISIIKTTNINFGQDIGNRVAHLFVLGYYDTCIREACIQLEHEIRNFTGSVTRGDKLIEVFVRKISNERNYLESKIWTFQQELRSVFKFIRNEYMHNLLESDEASAYAILFRIAKIRAAIRAQAIPSPICAAFDLWRKAS